MVNTAMRWLLTANNFGPPSAVAELHVRKLDTYERTDLT